MKTWRSLLCTAVIGGLAFSASGQNAPQKQPANNPPPAEAPAPGNGPGGGPRAPRGMTPLAPEKAKAAWELQATGVAKRLGLDAEKTTAVVKAYTSARESQGAGFDKLRQEAMDRARDGGGDPQNRGADMMQAMDELNTAERAKLEKALQATLTPEQTTKALASLGTFNRQWDTIVDNLASLGLEPAKQQAALEAVEQYMIDTAAARGGGDREAMRAAVQEARAKVLAALKPVLSDDQYAKFEATLAPGGRMGGGGRGGNRGGGGN